MARTSKPLSILVHPSLKAHKDIVGLRAKGNEVYSQNPDSMIDDFDLVLGFNCWRIVPGMEDTQIPMAIKAARKERYGKATSKDIESD